VNGVELRLKLRHGLHARIVCSAAMPANRKIIGIDRGKNHDEAA